MAFPLLNISPSQLEFLFESERELKSTLNMRNLNDGVRVAFKIKTTNSERFVVCPPAGIVEPGTTRLVKIYLKAQLNYDDDLRLCKDRFLVQSIVVDHTTEERDVTSNLFRTGQRQEAKLKVIVAPPLAHSSVLENEIRTIAMRQGVEGHRAVVRKFSELLLARGIISQAQVVLAFSTVGEIFQGMQNAYKATTAERERSFQQFLGERTTGAPAAVAAAAAAPSGREVEEVATAPVPASPARTPGSGAAGDAAEVGAKASPAGEATVRWSDELMRPLDVDELHPSAAPKTPDAEPPAGEGGHGERARLADVLSIGSEEGSPEQTARHSNEDALDALLEANGRAGGEKAEIDSRPSLLAARDSFASAKPSWRQPAYAQGRQSSDSETDLAFGNEGATPEKPWLGHRASARQRTIGELIEAGVVDEGGSDVDQSSGPDEKAEIEPLPQRSSADTHEDSDEFVEYEIKTHPATSTAPGHIAMLTDVESQGNVPGDSADEASETWLTGDMVAGPSQWPPVGRRTQQPGGGDGGAGEIEVETESDVEASTSPAAETSTRPQSAGPKWSSKEPSRLVTMTSIDRLATPAIRKSAQPYAGRPAETSPAGVGNGSNLDEPHMKPALKSWRAPDDGARAPLPALDVQAGRDLELEPQGSARSTGSPSGDLGITIPSGNTRKMAHLFARRND